MLDIAKARGVMPAGLFCICVGDQWMRGRAGILICCSPADDRLANNRWCLSAVVTLLGRARRFESSPLQRWEPDSNLLWCS